MRKARTVGRGTSLNNVSLVSNYLTIFILTAIVAGLIASCGGGSDPSSSSDPVTVSPGSVSPTGNPLVAQYSITTGRGAKVKVEFGTDTSYPFHTSTVSAPANGGLVNVLVAGMKMSTTYHMRAVVLYNDGAQAVDVDHVFTTGAPEQQLVPAVQAPTVQVSGSSLTPSPGIEMLSLVFNGSAQNNLFQVATEDLLGNLIWYYNDPAIQPPYIPGPVKLLNDGSIVIDYSNITQTGLDSILRDVDLAGNTNWQITAQDLAQSLAAKGCFTGATVVGSHHDFAELPNGHLIILVSLQQSFTNLTGYPGTTVVTGDGLVDLDQNRNPAWCWSEFDHLDVNRHPMNFPDWTHTNAVFYSPRDGNLIISIRHQNWLIKINYNNGAGDGSIIWHLGYQGDFTLQGGIAPADWFYAQHGPSIISDKGKESLTLGIFDNGNDRVVDNNGDLCGTSGQIACLSRATVYQLDEKAMTATLSFHYDLPYFSGFGGNVEQLANSDLEFDAAESSASDGTMEELTYGTDPQLVWQLQVVGQWAYRGFRMPSLYPGVQW